MNEPNDKNKNTDADVLAKAVHYMVFFATHPASTTPELEVVARRFSALATAGVCLAHWLDARETQPPSGTPVQVAYLWPGDEEYTVDTAEMDGDKWRYSGGQLMTSEQVHWWCYPPCTPAVTRVHENADQWLEIPKFLRNRAA